MDLLPLTDRFLALLWRASWQASVLVLLVLIVHWVFGKRLAPKWRYALWFLVVIPLLLPVTPSSAWSVFNVGNPERLSEISFDRWSRDKAEESNRPLAADNSREVQPASTTASAPSSATGPAPVDNPTAPSRRSFLQSTLGFVRQNLVWIWFWACWG